MNETNDAGSMFAPIWRRKWLILAVGVLVAVGTYLHYKREHPVYGATTQIYLGAGAEEEQTVTGTRGLRKAGSSEGAAQAALINSPIVKQPVRVQLRAMRKRHPSKAVRAALTGKVKAKSSEKSEFVTISAEARNASGAALLADLTAQTYERRQNQKFRQAIESAIALTRRQLRRVEASAEPVAETGKGKTTTSTKSKGQSTSVALQIAQLSAKINQYEAELGLATVKQVGKAAPEDLSSSPKRNAIFGFVIGLLLASIAVYVLARVDRRLRTVAEIEAAFQTPVLTAIPETKRPLVLEGGQPRPSRVLVEALQRLNATLRVSGPHGQGVAAPRKILFLSPQSGDGSSTVVADLALVERDAGQAVAIVEADLRRPMLARLLGVTPQTGLAEVLAGRLSLHEALAGVGGSPAQAEALHVEGSPPGVATMVSGADVGSASLLAGGVAANPAMLLGSPAVAEILAGLAADHDHVLIDAPAPLEVSDVIPLLGLVDGIVIVARANQTRRVAASRLMQLLARTPSAPVLGVVANGAAPKDIERYGFSNGGPRRLRRLLGA